MEAAGCGELCKRLSRAYSTVLCVMDLEKFSACLGIKEVGIKSHVSGRRMGRIFILLDTVLRSSVYARMKFLEIHQLINPSLDPWPSIA
jgi:hypothetical protein